MIRDAHLWRLNIFKLPINCASMPRSAIYRLRRLDIMTGAIINRKDASPLLLPNSILSLYLVISQIRFRFCASLSVPLVSLVLFCLSLSRDLLASSSADPCMIDSGEDRHEDLWTDWTSRELCPSSCFHDIKVPQAVES